MICAIVDRRRTLFTIVECGIHPRSGVVHSLFPRLVLQVQLILIRIWARG